MKFSSTVPICLLIHCKLIVGITAIWHVSFKVVVSLDRLKPSIVVTYTVLEARTEYAEEYVNPVVIMTLVPVEKVGLKRKGRQPIMSIIYIHIPLGLLKALQNN